MTLRVMRGDAKRQVQLSQKLSNVSVGLGLPTVDEMEQEMDNMVDIMLGRIESPIESPYLAMQEVATAYFARGQEWDILIHRGEREGLVIRGSELYKFRTGQLRSFLELAKKCADLGSRRLSQETLLAQQRYDANS